MAPSQRAKRRKTWASLSEGARRRTPGLRREEVAGLAGMSIDYYTRLEQSRGPQPSVQMLAALARALTGNAELRALAQRLVPELVVSELVSA